MRIAVIAVIAGLLACKAPSRPTPTPDPAVSPASTVSPVSPVSIDAIDELGWLAIVPALPEHRAHAPGWVPAFAAADRIAAFLPEPWAGGQYSPESRFPPAPLVVDARGHVLRGRYGDEGMLRDYCGGHEHGLVPVHGPTQTLDPGVAWLLPGVHEAWRPRVVPSVVVSSTETRRTHALGPVTVEIVRTAPASGALRFRWRGAVVHEVELARPERSDGEDSPEAPLDLRGGDLRRDRGVPFVEAAWAVGGTDEEPDAILVVLRTWYRGVHTTFQGIALDRRHGRDAQVMVLCYAAP